MVIHCVNTKVIRELKGIILPETEAGKMGMGCSVIRVEEVEIAGIVILLRKTSRKTEMVT